MPPIARRRIGFLLGGAALGALFAWWALSLPAPASPQSLVLPTGQRSTQQLAASASKKFDPNRPNAEGKTPLLLAVETGDHALVAHLFELGAAPDLAAADGVTPLMLAASKGDTETVRALVAHSHQLEAVDAGGWTAAHYAVQAQDRAALAVLLPAVTKVDQPTADGRTLLTLATETADPGIMSDVLARVSAPLAWSAETRAILHCALEQNDAALLRLVLSKHPEAPTAEGSNTPLLAQAIAAGDGETFNALLAAGIDPNTTIPTPADKQFIKEIKSENMRSYVRSDEGVTVLMLAAGLGKTEYVRALLDAGAERFRSTHRLKMLALYFAAHSGRAACIQTLLGRGPSPDDLRVEISLATQRAAVIKNGVPILKTAISTGRKGFDTPAGEFVITDKRRDHVSSIYKVAMPYFMRLNCRDFGLHAGAVPSYPASHGCIRLPAEIAEKLFSELPVGTVVTIN